MPEFNYKIKIAGRTLKKTIEAPTQEAAIKMVKNKTGVDLKSVKPKPKEIKIPFLEKLTAPKITTKSITILCACLRQ
jgi:type II secretory pathway component PulF